jgi:uncharacterized protein YceK
MTQHTSNVAATPTERHPPVAVAAGAITPPLVSAVDVYQENARLKDELASLTRAKKVLSRAVTDKIQGKMTMKRMEKIFGMERAALVKGVITFIQRTVLPNQKIFHKDWTRFNIDTTRGLCSVVMKRVRLLEDDVPEVFWTLCIVPCLVQSLNDARNTYCKEAKKVFKGKNFRLWCKRIILCVKLPFTAKLDLIYSIPFFTIYESRPIHNSGFLQPSFP